MENYLIEGMVKIKDQIQRDKKQSRDFYLTRYNQLKEFLFTLACNLLKGAVTLITFCQACHFQEPGMIRYAFLPYRGAIIENRTGRE